MSSRNNKSPSPAPLSTSPALSSNMPPAVLFLFFLSAFISFNIFPTPFPGANINSRIDMLSAAVSDHSFIIDKYHYNTIDKAFIGGHYYSDKAPGLTLSALPAAFLYSAFRPADPDNISFRQTATAFSVSIPAAIFAVCFFVFLCGYTAPPTAFLTTCFLIFGTIFFPYSTLFYGHVPAALLSFALFHLTFRQKPPTAKTLFIFGFLSASMAIIEYPVALHAAILFIFIALRTPKKVLLLYIAPGAAIVAAVFLFYNHSIFGSFFDLGYFHESSKEFAAGHSKGVAGITFPKPLEILKLLVLPGRGLFFIRIKK